MTRALTLLLLLAAGGLSACAGQAGPPTPQQQCAREAEDDPVVQEMIRKGLGNSNYMISTQEQLRAARRDAANRCLQRRGLMRQGGVERYRGLSY